MHRGDRVHAHPRAANPASPRAPNQRVRRGRSPRRRLPRPPLERSASPMRCPRPVPRASASATWRGDAQLERGCAVAENASATGALVRAHPTRSRDGMRSVRARVSRRERAGGALGTARRWAPLVPMRGERGVKRADAAKGRNGRVVQRGASSTRFHRFRGRLRLTLRCRRAGKRARGSPTSPRVRPARRRHRARLPPRERPRRTRRLIAPPHSRSRGLSRGVLSIVVVPSIPDG